MNADTAAFAHYFEHHQDGWPVVDGWVNWEWDGDDLWCRMPGTKRDVRPIDIQALTGLLVVELAKRSGTCKVYPPCELGDYWAAYVEEDRSDEEADEYQGSTCLRSLVNAWMQIHGLPSCPT